MIVSCCHATPSVTDAVLDRIGASEIRPDLDGLTLLYRAWSREVGFDNVRKRLFQVGGCVGEVPGATAQIFLEDFLAAGTGGTCWSTSMGLTAVALAAGFNARLVTGVMHTDPELRPNHASVVITLEGELYLIDSSMLFDRPLPLRDTPVSHPGPLHPVSSTPTEPLTWLVNWLPGHSRSKPIGCDIHLAPVTDDQIRQWHDRTRVNSLFNHHLFLRRNTEAGLVCFGRGKLVKVDEHGRLSTTLICDYDRDTTVARLFGIDASLLSRIPVHADGPAFL